jgi:hypothetical protein
VEYRQGKLNGAADTLSHQEVDTAAVHAISAPTFELFNKLRDEIQHSPEAYRDICVCYGVVHYVIPYWWCLFRLLSIRLII